MNKIIRVSQVTVPLRHTRDQVIKRACRRAGINPRDLAGSSIVKQSVDARHKKDLKYSYTVDLEVEKKLLLTLGNGKIERVLIVLKRKNAQ